MRQSRPVRLALLLLALLLVGSAVGLGVALHYHSVVELKDQRIERVAHRRGYEEREVHTDDFLVRYWVGGEGPPLLLVHGWASFGTWNWSSQMRALDEYRVIVPDLPGFGESYVHQGVEPTMELEAAALRAVLDAEGVDQAHVIASSYGGFVALTLSTESPDRVGKLVLIDSPGHTYTRADHVEMLARLEVEDTHALFLPEGVDEVRPLMGAASRVPTGLVPRFLIEDLYEDLVMTQQDTKAALVVDLETRFGMPAPQVSGEDVLVVWGVRDGLFPLEVGERLAEDLGARFVPIKRTSHRPHAERSKRVNRELRRFLEDGE